MDSHSSDLEALDRTNWAALQIEAIDRDEIIKLMATTADPLGGFRRLDHFIQTHHTDKPEALESLGQRLCDPLWRQRLIMTLGNSPYLSHVMTKWPEFLADEYPYHDLASWHHGLIPALLATESRSEAAHILRWHKHRTFLGIGMRDLTREASLQETIEGLSALADASLEAGYQWLNRWLSVRHGPPMTLTEEGRKPACFVILGMGKLGAKELNFSSDVDLIYLYDEDQGGTDGPRPIAIKEYFNRLGRELIRLLGEATADGMVFRIDLRLRPEGESGDLTLSRCSAEIYYESWGRTWERAAMIKARPVAGDLVLGEQFLTNLQPFVYRRYLDFAALDAIREMKRMIDLKTAGREDFYRNVKLGYGGIREIEFFAQCHQLIHGGKNPELRIRGTEAVLRKLVELNLLATKSADTLITNYRFLRTVEHRLQIELERQTHSLPEEPKAYLALAKRMNFIDSSAFQHRFQGVVEEVRAIYGQLFFEGERESKKQDNPLITALLECDGESELCLQLIKQAGFENSTQAIELIRILREGPNLARLTESARSWYGRISIPLLTEILAAPDQDMALQHAESFLRRLGYRVNYLALLKENPLVMHLLMRIFGTSALLSRFLILHPELMDRLITTDFLKRFHNRNQLTQELKQAMDHATHPEDRLQIIREFKNVETLRLGSRDLSGISEPEEITFGLSLLAEVILTQIYTDAWSELVLRYGPPYYTNPQGTRQQAQFAILAMGKLGGKELCFSSDLDLIFIHGSRHEDQFTDHSTNSIANSLFFTRLGQKIITGITTLTRAGKLYELDMRLRPSGNSGPVVTSLDSFFQYQTHEAWTWEHQALTRVRPIAGDPEFVAELNNVIAKIFTRRYDPDALRNEVNEMREKMYEEKKPEAGWIDIKQSRGGVVDVEFLVQYLILAHVADHPKIVSPNLPHALLALTKANILAPTDAQVLEEAYGLYQFGLNRLRLLHDRSENRIGPDQRIRDRLQRLCHAMNNEAFIDAIEDRLQKVYAIYKKILQP